MSEEPLYELKKDVNMPGRYWRAGAKKTEREWKIIFQIKENWPFSWEAEWFIDLRVKPELAKDEILELVSEIFSKRELHSITYKEAACTCVREAMTRFKNRSHEQ